MGARGLGASSALDGLGRARPFTLNRAVRRLVTLGSQRPHRGDRRQVSPAAADPFRRVGGTWGPRVDPVAISRSTTPPPRSTPPQGAWDISPEGAGLPPLRSLCSLCCATARSRFLYPKLAPPPPVPQTPPPQIGDPPPPLSDDSPSDGRSIEASLPSDDRGRLRRRHHGCAS